MGHEKSLQVYPGWYILNQDGDEPSVIFKRKEALVPDGSSCITESAEPPSSTKLS
jgi:hypothetical protein